jgi:hypothetical protein
LHRGKRRRKAGNNARKEGKNETSAKGESGRRRGKRGEDVYVAYRRSAGQASRYYRGS